MTDHPTTPLPEADDEPQVFAVSKQANKVKFTRREFLEVAAVAGAALTLAGCSNDGQEIETAIRLTQTAASQAGGQEPVATSANVPASPTKAPTKTKSPTATKRPTATPEPEPQATVTVASSNLRGGPGTNYGVLLTLKKGDVLTVIGRTADGTWLEVVIRTGKKGWVALSVVELSVQVNVIPVQHDIPVPPATSVPSSTPVPTTPPQPTAPPGVPGEVQAGQTGINYTIEGRTFTLPCGAPIPAGAVCICNCVSVPAAPAATSCSCDTVCTCDTVCECVGASHYWYPN